MFITSQMQDLRVGLNAKLKYLKVAGPDNSSACDAV
jgi:hypothetical protein